MISEDQKRELIQRRGGKCNKCGKQVNMANAEIHHKNKNEKDDRPENLRLLCRACHYEVHGKKL